MATSAAARVHRDLLPGYGTRPAREAAAGAADAQVATRRRRRLMAGATSHAFEDARTGRIVMLSAVFFALAAGGWTVAKIHVLLVVLYVPVAIVFLILLDAAVIQRIFPLQRTHGEVTRLLQSILDGAASERDWRRLVILRIENPTLDAIRGRLLAERSGDPNERRRIVEECLDELRRGAS